MEHRENSFLEQEPVGKLMMKYAIPCIISLLVAAMMAINNMIQKYGALDAVFSRQEYAQIPMAVVGIVMKFFQIVVSIAVGMAAGCIPVVGYNVGAKRNDRVKVLFTRLLVCESAAFRTFRSAGGREGGRCANWLKHVEKTPAPS